MEVGGIESMSRIQLRIGRQFHFVSARIAAAFVSLCLASGAASAEPVKVPCGDASTGLSDCQEVKQRSKTLLTERAQEIVNGWYQGDNFYPRTCSILPTIFNTGPELEQDHDGRSCGQWSRLETSYSKCGKRCRNSYTHVNSTGDLGARERAYVAGGYVAAVDCWLTRVKRQIDEGTLKITACQAMGRGLNESFQELSAGVKDIAKNVKDANARAIINKCDHDTQVKSEGEREAARGEEAGILGEELVMRSCRLIAQRQGTEAMFQQLAVCEVFAQAKKAFDEFDHEMLNPKAVYARIDQWAKACKGCGTDNSCHNSCYQQKYLDFIRNQIQSRFGRCG